MNIGIQILGYTTGLFFAITGWRKLVLPDAHKQVWSLFDKLHIPEPLRWCAVIGEWVGGVVMIGSTLAELGIALVLSALLLSFIIAVALITDVIPEVIAKQTEHQVSKLISNLLCTPEAQLFIILLAIIFGGVSNDI